MVENGDSHGRSRQNTEGLCTENPDFPPCDPELNAADCFAVFSFAL